MTNGRKCEQKTRQGKRALLMFSIKVLVCIQHRHLTKSENQVLSLVIIVSRKIKLQGSDHVSKLAEGT